MTTGRLSLPPLPLAIRSLTDHEAQRLREAHPSLPRTTDDCPTCQGATTFAWWNRERTHVVEYDCPCVDQWRLHRYLLHCGVGVALQRLSWADAVHVEPAAVEVVNDYLEHRERYVRSGVGLVLTGSVGSGKSLIAALLLKGLIGKGHEGYFTTFVEMLDAEKGGWRDDEQRRWFDGRVRHAGVLVIDDVGRESQGRMERVESTFDHVLRTRVANALPTILTTNLSMEHLKQAYRSNVMSLLSEVSITHTFTGEDYRPQARERFLQEVREGLTRPLVLS